jgi:hypothetical protein
MRIDVTVTSTPGNYPKEDCGEQPCVPLYTLSDEDGIVGYEGFKDRFVIVDVAARRYSSTLRLRQRSLTSFCPRRRRCWTA